MTYAIVDNYNVALSATLGVTDMTLQVASPPNVTGLSALKPMLLTIYNLNGVQESNHEVVRAIGLVGNQFTLDQRAVSGVATQFLAGARVAVRWNAKAATDALTLAGPLTSTERTAVKTVLGVVNVDNTSDVNKPVSTAQAAANAATLAAAQAYTDEHTQLEDLHALFLTF